MIAIDDAADLDLLIEALDSHVDWQLSDPLYRNDGMVHGRGSDDRGARAEIRRSNRLIARLERVRHEIQGCRR